MIIMKKEMSGNSFVSLISGLGSALIFINAQTPGKITTPEIIMDLTLMVLILVCIVFNKKLSTLAESKLPFIAPLLDSVERCCSQINKTKECNESEPVETDDTTQDDEPVEAVVSDEDTA